MAFANATYTQIDGPRNTVTRTVGDGTQNAALPTAVTIQDPATLTDMDPGAPGANPATKLRVDHIEYSISDGITVQLYFDATTPIAICELYGRGKLDWREFGGIANNAGTGVTGKILMTIVAADQAATAVTVSWLVVLRTVKCAPARGGA